MVRNGANWPGGQGQSESRTVARCTEARRKRLFLRSCGRRWRPARIVSGANRRDVKLQAATLDSESGGRMATRRMGADWGRAAAGRRGQRTRRRLVEWSHSWFDPFRKLLVRHEKKEAAYLALTSCTAALLLEICPEVGFVGWRKAVCILRGKGTGRRRLCLAGDNPGEPLGAVEPAPAFRGRLSQLPCPRSRRLPRAAALGAFFLYAAGPWRRCSRRDWLLLWAPGATTAEEGDG